MNEPFYKVDGAKKAWIVSNDDGHSFLVFCNHGLQAQRLGAECLDEEFDSVSGDRAKEYDQYANIDGEPSHKTLFEKYDWWYHCDNCNDRVTTDEISEYKQPLLCELCQEIADMKPLFIPLKKKFFEAFKDGSKTKEYRKVNKNFNSLTCIVGRKVILSNGYGKYDRLNGVITNINTTTSPQNLDGWVEYYGKENQLAIIISSEGVK